MNTNKLNPYLILGSLLVLVFTWQGCIPQKQFIYMQNASVDSIYLNQPTVHTLCVGDLLSIEISGLKPETYQFFNKNKNTNVMGGPAAIFLMSYSVDQQGSVNLPLIGKIELIGLTVEQAKKKLQIEIDRYLSDAIIDVRLMSYRVTVLGEVNRPGEIYIYNEYINLLQVIGLAGDLTQFGNRKKIRLIRQEKSGFRNFEYDLTDPKIMSNINFYIKPNDIIYVEPLKAKPNRDNFPAISLVLSLISTTLVLISFTLRL